MRRCGVCKLASAKPSKLRFPRGLWVADSGGEVPPAGSEALTMARVLSQRLMLCAQRTGLLDTRAENEKYAPVGHPARCLLYHL